MQVKRVLSLLSLLLIFTLSSFSQDEVVWKFSIKDAGNGEIDLIANANIKAGWHIYDIDIPEGGPTATTLSIDKIVGAKPVGKFKVLGKKANVKFDPMFEMNIGTFDNSTNFAQRFKITDKAKFALEGDIRAQACNEGSCLPPTPIDFAFSSKDLPTTVTVAQLTAEEAAQEATVAELLDTATVASDSLATPAVTSSDLDVSALWTPVIEELKEYGMKGSVAGRSLIWILISGFIGGFIALLTPCIWPLIPMTVSFFLKRNKTEKKKAINEAVIYGASIIVIYVSLGLIITGIFGASALNDLSTSAIFNLIFFALLVFFAIAFFGAFDLVLPASWTNKMDEKADKAGGLLGIFFMAFTLALVSFSCTGPIIGTLLVDAATSGNILAPAVGMFGFAVALSIPFALFAIFPSWLQSLPKSGGWLNSVKVVLGFLELALALKFLSVADLAYGWRILDREVFLVLWIVIFALLGFYLIGKLKFKHDSDLPYVSVPRLFMAIISFAFAIYMVPGLWGAPLKSISAFSPPIYTQDFNLYDGSVHAKFMDYESAMVYAKQNNKPVMIDFSGYGCVNCRNMEASVWTDARVKNILDNDYVLVTLMVDDKTKLPEVIEVEENGKITKLKTVGDKWSYLQRYKFGANAQPYYIALDLEGKPIAPSYAFDQDVNRYLEFLETGLRNFKNQQ